MAQDTPASTDFSLFVGDLAPDVDDALLEHTFRTYYPSTRIAKVMLDPSTGRSRGYGFVRFGSEQERDRSLTEMNGVYISTRPVRVSLATARRNVGSSSVATTGSAGGASSASSRDQGGENDPHNTTLFIGGLSPSVTEAELHAAFSRYGEIVYTKIPQGKGCGFVQFVSRPAAEYAMQEMNGHPLGGMPIRISWGKSTGKAPSAPSHQASHLGTPQYSSYYGAYDPYGAYSAYGMAYDPYGYGAYPGMDPYASAYPAYGMPPGMASYPSVAAAAAASAAAGAHPGATPGSVQPVLYDPLAPVCVDKMNMAFMHRHIPVLTGAFMRMPMAVPMAGPM